MPPRVPDLARPPLWPSLLALVAALAACTSLNEEQKSHRRAEIRARWQVTVSEVVGLGPYLAATLEGEQGRWRLYFPRSGSCLELIQAGQRPVYRFEGPFGVVVGEDRTQRCSPVGVGSLVEWRDQQPRRRSQYLVPREQARFAPIPLGEGDPDGQLLLHGSFPLALEIRWPEPMDAVAVVPATPACRAQLDLRKTTMEFRAEGEPVFVLLGDAGPCPIHGFALPLGL